MSVKSERHIRVITEHTHIQLDCLIVHYSKTSRSSRNTATRGHFLRTVSYIPHVKEPVM